MADSATPPVHRRRTSSPWALMFFLAVSYGVAALGAFASADAGTVYRALDRPEWAPPAWLFGPVWTVLYAMIGIAAWMVWRHPDRGRVRTALVWWSLQLRAEPGLDPVVLRSPPVRLRPAGHPAPAGRAHHDRRPVPAAQPPRGASPSPLPVVGSLRERPQRVHLAPAPSRGWPSCSSTSSSGSSSPSPHCPARLGRRRAVHEDVRPGGPREGPGGPPCGCGRRPVRIRRRTSPASSPSSSCSSSPTTTRTSPRCCASWRRWEWARLSPPTPHRPEHTRCTSPSCSPRQDVGGAHRTHRVGAPPHRTGALRAHGRGCEPPPT